MEVVAPGEVTAPPFALCPRFNVLAVGMALPVGSRGDADETGASRVDVLRLLRPTGDLDLNQALQFDSFVPAPGLRRVAWSSTLTDGDQDGESASGPTVEELIYPAGLLAGGFNDGAVRLWDPKPAMTCNVKNASVSRKPGPEFMLDEDPDKAQHVETNISVALKKMKSKSEMYQIVWTYEGKEYFKIEEEDVADKWQVVPNDPEWEMLEKEEPVAKYHELKEMKLLTELNNFNGPVLGLSFSEVHPYWMASAALGDRIYIHDLHHPFQISKKKRELSELPSEKNTQTTCLKWSKTFPCLLASASQTGVAKVWDVRAPKCSATFTTKDNMSGASDIEFSMNNPYHLAVASADNGTSVAVKIWDLRRCVNPAHEYGCAAPGVLSLSWNGCGNLLASHKDGKLSCYNPYKKKAVEQMDFVHYDLGVTWTHSDDTVAAFSSRPQSGVRLYDIGWSLLDS